MIKKYFLIFTIIINFSFTINIAFAETIESKPKTETLKAKSNFLLPPVRRVGIDIVETNIDEFRNFMRQQDRLLYGVVALPFNEQDIKKTLAADLEQQTVNTGRFWDLSFTEFLKIIPSENQQDQELHNKVTKLKQKLEQDYNLDAWIKSKVIFSPDQTLVRLSLNGVESAQGNWAREDILLEAQASEEKIKSAFSEALSRLISTIGHDGKVTYSRENLMTVDFGSERGVQQGEKIIAGYVILKSYIPQSGEFLRAQRVPLYELKVLEARKGSSLCEIKAVDQILIDQMSKIYDSGSPILLAWRPEIKEKNTGWHEPYDPQTAPIVGAAESGFGVPIEKKERPTLPKNMVDSTQTQQKLIAPPQPIYADKTPSPDIMLEGEEPIAKPLIQRHAVWNSPGSWTAHEFKIGLGVTLGSIAQGDASSFPSTVLNRFTTSGIFLIDTKNQLYLHPYAQYAFFDGNGISGDTYILGGTVYNSAWNNPAERQNLYLGGDIQITGRQIKGASTSKDLSNIQISPALKWESDFPNIGRYKIEGAFSAFDLIQLQPVWTFVAEIQPSELMTKKISFDIGMKRYIHDWIEFSLGANWNFLAPD